MKDIGVLVDGLDLWVVGIGKTLNFPGGDTFGAGKGDKKISKFGTN